MKSLIEKYHKKNWANIFVIYLRYLIGGAFVFSAMPKIFGQRFVTSNCEDAPIDTFMHFFETLYRSGLYWNFLGWSQLIASLLLMTQLFSALGALAFFPIILNVFVITVAYEFGGTPIITGLMLLANIFLLMWDYKKLEPLFMFGNKRIEMHSPTHPYYNNLMWAWLGLLLFFTTVVYVATFGRNPIGWFLVCVVVGFGGLIFIRRKKN